MAENNGGDGIELKDMTEVILNNGIIEDCVTCVITSTDWARSRFSYTLPFLSDVSTLYSGVVKQAG